MGDVQSTKLDHDLMKAILDCLGDGKIDADEAKNKILPKIADGRGRRSELTCNERWTIRYAMGEFAWDFDARKVILNAMPTMDVLDTADKKITDQAQIQKVLHGPSLAELQQPDAKKAKGPRDNLILVDGMYLDKEMLIAVQEGISDDQVIDACEAVKIFQAAADKDMVLTRCERWTFRFILASHVFTDAAFNFLKEALSKLAENNEHDAD